MRHRVAYRKLGRTTAHRLSMLRNQAQALLRHEHLTTTVPRAKELRPFVERLITIAKRGVEGGANGKALHARRMVMQDIQDGDVVTKLFDTIVPRCTSRPGGYTRLLRLGFRRGDSAEIAQVELVGSEFTPGAKAESEAKAEGAKPKAMGMAGRLRAAAERLRGKKAGEPGVTGAGAASEKRGGGRGGSRASKKAPGGKSK